MAPGGEITLFVAIGGLPTDKSVFGSESQPTDTPPAPNTRPFSPFSLPHSVSQTHVQIGALMHFLPPF